MAVNINKKFWNGNEYKDISKIVFTSPNFNSPAVAGTRSHIQPGSDYIGTWYESVDFMYKQKIDQDYVNNRESMESFFGIFELKDDFDLDRDSSAKFKTDYNSNYFINDTIDYIYKDKFNYAKVATSSSFLTVSGIEISFLIPDHTDILFFNKTNKIWWNSIGLDSDELLNIYIDYNSENTWHLLAHNIRNTGSFSFTMNYLNSKGFEDVCEDDYIKTELLPAKEVYRATINEDDALVRKGYATLSAIIQSSHVDTWYKFQYKDTSSSTYISTDQITIDQEYNGATITVSEELTELVVDTDYEFKLVYGFFGSNEMETETRQFSVNSQYQINCEVYMCQAKLKVSYLGAYEVFSETFYMKEESFISGTPPKPEITYSPEVLEVPYSEGTPYQPYVPPSGDRVSTQQVLSDFTDDYDVKGNIIYDKINDKLYRCEKEALYQFDFILNRWEFLVTTPFIAENLSFTIKNNCIFIIVEENSHFYKYNIAIELWERLSDYPLVDVEKLELVSVDGIDDKLFVKFLDGYNAVNGDTGADQRSYEEFDECYVYEYNINTGDWKDFLYLTQPEEVGISEVDLLLDDVISVRDVNLSNSISTSLLTDKNALNITDDFIGPITFIGSSTEPSYSVPYTVTIDGSTVSKNISVYSTIPETTISGTTSYSAVFPDTLISGIVKPGTSISGIGDPYTTIPGNNISGNAPYSITIYDSVVSGVVIPGVTASGIGDPSTTIPGTTISGTTSYFTTISGVVVSGTTTYYTTVFDTVVNGTTASGTTISGIASYYTNIPSTNVSEHVTFEEFISGTVPYSSVVSDIVTYSFDIESNTVSGGTYTEGVFSSSVVSATTISKSVDTYTTIHGGTAAGIITYNTTVSGTTVSGTTISGVSICTTTIPETDISGIIIPETDISTSSPFSAIILGTTVYYSEVPEVIVSDYTMVGTLPYSINISESTMSVSVEPYTTILGGTVFGTTYWYSTIPSTTVFGTSITQSDIFDTANYYTSIFGNTFYGISDLESLISNDITYSVTVPDTDVFGVCEVYSTSVTNTPYSATILGSSIDGITTSFVTASGTTISIDVPYHTVIFGKDIFDTATYLLDMPDTVSYDPIAPGVTASGISSYSATIPSTTISGVIIPEIYFSGEVSYYVSMYGITTCTTTFPINTVLDTVDYYYSGVMYRHEENGLYMFSNENNLWQHISNSPMSSSEALIVIEGIIYFIDGSSFYSFSIEGNKWEQLRDLNSYYIGDRGHQLYNFDNAPDEIYLVTTSYLAYNYNPTVFLNKYTISTGYWDNISSSNILSWNEFIFPSGTLLFTKAILPFAFLFKDSTDNTNANAISLVSGEGIFCRASELSSYTNEDLSIGGQIIEDTFPDGLVYTLSIIASNPGGFGLVKGDNNPYFGDIIPSGIIPDSLSGNTTYYITINGGNRQELSSIKSPMNTYSGDIQLSGVISEIGVDSLVYSLNIKKYYTLGTVIEKASYNPTTVDIITRGSLTTSLYDEITYTLSTTYGNNAATISYSIDNGFNWITESDSTAYLTWQSSAGDNATNTSLHQIVGEEWMDLGSYGIQIKFSEGYLPQLGQGWTITVSKNTPPKFSWTSSSNDDNSSYTEIVSGTYHPIGDFGAEVLFPDELIDSMSHSRDSAWIINVRNENPPTMVWSTNSSSNSSPIVIDSSSTDYVIDNNGLTVSFPDLTLESMYDNGSSTNAWTMSPFHSYQPNIVWESSDLTEPSGGAGVIEAIEADTYYDISYHGIKVMFSDSVINLMTESEEDVWTLSFDDFEFLGHSKISLNSSEVSNISLGGENLIKLYPQDYTFEESWGVDDYSGVFYQINDNKLEFLLASTQSVGENGNVSNHMYKFIRGAITVGSETVYENFNVDLGIISTDPSVGYYEHDMVNFRDTLGPIDLFSNIIPRKIRMVADERYIYMYASLNKNNSFYDKYFYRIPFKQSILDYHTVEDVLVQLPGAYNITNNIILSSGNSLYSLGRTSGTVLTTDISNNTNYTCSLDRFNVSSNQKSFFGPVIGSSGPYTFGEKFVSNTVFDKINNKIYLIGGNDTLNFGVIDLVDITYTKLKNCPWLLKYGNSADIIGDHVYLIQGADSSGFSRYCISLDNWEVLQSLPPSFEAEEPILCSSNNDEYLYIKNNFDTNLYRYVINSDQWYIIKDVFVSYEGVSSFESCFKTYFKRYNMLYFIGVYDESVAGLSIITLNVDTLESKEVVGKLITPGYEGTSDKLNNIFYIDNLIFTSVNYDVNSTSNSLLFSSNLYTDYSQTFPIFLEYITMGNELCSPILFFGDSSEYIYSLSLFSDVSKIYNHIIIKRIEVNTGVVTIIGTSSIEYTEFISPSLSKFDNIHFNSFSGDIVKVSATKFEFMLASTFSYDSIDEINFVNGVCFRGIIDFNDDFLSFEFTPVDINPIYYDIHQNVPISNYSIGSNYITKITSDNKFFYMSVFNEAEDSEDNHFYRLPLKTFYDEGSTCSGVSYLPWYIDGSIYKSSIVSNGSDIYCLGGHSSSYLYKMDSTEEIDFSVANMDDSVFGEVTDLNEGPYIFDKDMMKNLIIDDDLNTMYLLGEYFISVNISTNTYTRLSFPYFDFNDDFSFVFLNDYIYLSPGVPYNTIFRYDVVNDLWEELTSFPANFVSNNIICKADNNNYLYVFNSNDSDMYQYNILTGVWITTMNYFNNGENCPTISVLNSIYKDGSIYFFIDTQIVKFVILSMTANYYFSYNFSSSKSPGLVNNSMFTNTGDSLVKQNLVYTQSDPIPEVIEVPETPYVPYSPEIPYSEYVAPTYSGSDYLIYIDSPDNWEFSTDLTSPDSVIMNFDVSFSEIEGSGVLTPGTLMYHQFSGSSITEESSTPIKRYHCGENSVIFTVTFGEAYSCRLTAWDDDTHSTVNNKILSEEHYRVDAAVYRSNVINSAHAPTFNTENCFVFPQANNIVLKGDEKYYGDFDLIYVVKTDEYGEYLSFIPRLVDMDDSFSPGNYGFITTLHYNYT